MHRSVSSIEEKRERIINYLKQHSRATHKDIRRDLSLHPERLFSSLEEAFKKAGLESPRNFKIKTKDERRKIIINYIKEHPRAGGQTIAKDTKINVHNAFKNIKEAFEYAEIDYPRKIDSRKKEEKREKILQLIRENPFITIKDLSTKLKANPYKLFKNINHIYQSAGINKVKGNEKIIWRKQIEVISFIKKNPLATQREINQNCKTHVQELFLKGIFEAYEKAEISFPFERLRLYGIGLKEVTDRAQTFEEQIAIKLSGYGNVNRLVKTKRGIADIILERKDKKIVIEVKDYKNKDISFSQVKQLNKYLEDLNVNVGILICHKKPKKDKFLIDKNKIFILEEGELTKFPFLIDGSVV